jgi:Carboxypeptidase regulatory-like domain
LIGMVALLPVIAGTTGSITGVVKDGAGAPVAGGKLTLLNKTMGMSVMATTDRKGSYGFPIVAPGTYTLHAEAKGFAPQDRSGLVVHVNSALRIDLILEPEKAAQ